MLLKAGADPNKKNSAGNTPLHASAEHNFVDHDGDAFGVLLRAGADPDAVNRNGMTPLLLFAEENADYKPRVRRLLDAGADPDRKAPNGDTALHIAIHKDGKASVVQALLAGGADPCIRDKDGYLPIQHAAGGSYDQIKAYLDRAHGFQAACEEREEAVRQACADEKGLRLDRAKRRRVQEALAAEGFDPGPPDGLFGPRTRAAISGWQEARTDSETGCLTAAQAQALHGDVESVAAARKEEPAQAADAKPRWEVGKKFRDCAGCPEMVVVPSGSFEMGSPDSESGRYHDEGPVHRVEFGRPFAVGVYEVTFGEWEACVSGGGCGGYRPDAEGWGRGKRPVINVSWEDAKGYVRWLSRETSKEYRLLSESEWEYVARAGTRGQYHFGSGISPSQANYGRNEGRTVPVGSYSANAWGLHDVHGNVWEWVEDCWNKSYRGAPNDGSAWESGDCTDRVLRGGSWDVEPRSLRSALRERFYAGYRSSFFGFRVARTLD